MSDRNLDPIIEALQELVDECAHVEACATERNLGQRVQRQVDRLRAMSELVFDPKEVRKAAKESLVRKTVRVKSTLP